MPRYFFETNDGTRSVEDSCSLELQEGDLNHQVLQTLLELALFSMSRGEVDSVSVVAKDEAKEPVMSAALKLSVRYNRH